MTVFLQVDYVTPAPVLDLPVIHWEPAVNLADHGLQVTKHLRTQRSALGVRKWRKEDFNLHKRPVFSPPKIGDLVCLNQLPKGKGILLGVQPVGAEGDQATQWMCPCGWCTQLSKPGK